MSEGGTADDKLIRVILAIRNGLTLTVEELNKVLKSVEPRTFEKPRAALKGIPRIDLANLEDAGWLDYKTKEPAAKGQPAWMKNPVHFTQFEPPPVIFELVKALKKSPEEKLQLGEYEYSFSGKGDMARHFLARRPFKPEKAR